MAMWRLRGTKNEVRRRRSRSTGHRRRPEPGAAGRCDRTRLCRQEPFALQLLADQLPGAADRLGLLAGPPLGGLLTVAAELHLAKDALALHLLLEGAERLIDVVVADENLHARAFLSDLVDVGKAKRAQNAAPPPWPGRLPKSKSASR